MKPVLKLMSLIGTLSGGRSVTQVALNYLMQKGEDSWTFNSSYMAERCGVLHLW